MSESAPSQTPIAEADKLAATWAKLRVGHEAVMLQDAAEVLRTNRGIVKAHNREFLGPAWQETGDDGVIHIGDVNQSAPQQVAQSASPLSAMAKIFLAFAISGPIGAGIAAIPLIQSWLSKPAVVAPVNPPATPNPQTLYDLRLGGS